MFNVNTVLQTQSLGTSLSESNSNDDHSHQRHSQFHEQKLVDEFCRKTQLRQIIEQAVDSLLHNYRRTRKPEEALAPLLLRLDFNYTELAKHATQLLHLAIEEPLQFAEAVKYSVYGQVRNLLKAAQDNNGLKTIDIAQLHIQWRLLDLPLQTNLLFNPTHHQYPLGLALVSGILSAYTLPETLVSNISPVLSATSSLTTTAGPKSIWGDAANKSNLFKNQVSCTNDEEFPTVGTIRRKKPKDTRAGQPAIPTSAAAAAAPSAAAAAPSTAAGGGAAQGSGRALLSTGNCVDKQAVITKWLNLVQQPIVQTQLLETPMLQSVTSMSAPAAIAPQQQQQLSQQSQGHNKPEQQQTTTSAPSGQGVAVSIPTSHICTKADVALGNEENQQLQRIDFNSNANRSEAANIEQSSIWHEPNSIRKWRRNKRRLQADQMPQMNGPQDYPVQQQMPPHVPDVWSAGSTGRSDNCNPLQQSNNPPLSSSQFQSQSQSQSQLFDITSCSTLNCNANEFYPNQCPNERRQMISDRRRRQRFFRTLKPNTVFKLIALPPDELQMSQPTSTNWEPHPTYNISPNNNSINNSQSVFRLSSFRSGIGTHSEDQSTICDPFDSSISRPLLNMDTQELQSDTSMFFEPDRNTKTTSTADVNVHLDDVDHEEAIKSDNKSVPALPRHMIFVAADSRQGDRQSVTVDMNFMPPSIKQLYHLICSKYSDYAFVYTLSAQLSQLCVPMECYVYLKMALLSSLASIEQDELRPPISLCVICSDSSVAHQLLDSVGQLAPRFIGPHEGGQQSAFTALPTRNNWVVASPILLAQQGVYYVGDWNRLTRDQSEEIEKCIENGSVAVVQLQSQQPLEAAIWTYWQPENAANQTTAFAKLCPIFGLPVYMDEHVNDRLWDFVLRSHSADGQDTTPDSFNINNEDIRSMLGLLHQRQVSFTQPAQQLLQKYYVVSRIEQPTAFSSKTYIVLKQFAESIAKLSMRLEVLEADVTVAIFHCEHFVRSIFGAGDYPPPAVASFSAISRIDPYMNEFARWLFQYLDRYKDDMNMNDGK
ncbi:GH24636 [Drosophila grimshawi]|uniref:GH24636 n=1 Tax=Drosophila grimshawi TaxID=7222 RepID=B4JMI7_DROGR|nr:GH24636 [Drosophila grimshawi]